jgi:hypothetical protein
MKVTLADLNRAIDRLNRRTGNPLEPYTRTGDIVKSNAGCFVLDGAYGGCKLSQIVEGGGQRDVLRVGYKSKRDTYNLIHAFVDGIEYKALGHYRQYEAKA